LSCGLSAVVHNGMIRNDESLFKELKLKRTAETDSDIIRGIIDEYGFTEKCIKMLNRIDGGVGAAAFSTKYPKKMLLLRSGNPIVLGSTADFLFFSSEKNTLHRAMKPWLKRFNIFFQVQQTGAAFAPMADDTAWLIGLEGQEAHWEFKSLLGTYSSPNRNTYSKYKNKKLKVLADADKVEKEDAWCPKCKKIWTIPKGGVAKLFRCNPKEGGCNRTLEEMPYKKGTIVSVPGVGNKYVGGSEGNGGCKYCLEGIELTQTGDYHKLSDGGLVWCTRDKKRKT